MKKFLFLVQGFRHPNTGDRAILDGLVQPRRRQHADSGNPMTGGVEVTLDRVHRLALGPESFTGYSIINAESIEAAIQHAKTNPMITSVVVHELART